MSEETLFQEALSRSPKERAAFLERACAGRPELRAAVEALLAAHEKPGNLLDRPPAAPDPGTQRQGANSLAARVLDRTPAAPDPGTAGEHTPQPEDAPPPPASTTVHRPDSAPGAVIAGRYTLVEKIGEGGMGEVWVAKQTEPVKRKVALKLIKAGMDSRAVVRRFEQERQALSLMDHPNIARVLDGGLTPDRRPFFVMELVNSLPLTRFCDEARLGIRGRLELFVSVCQAVQHAHQKGVVHRDLKPANILVTVIDGRGVPKVIDFGVAKAVSGRLTDESLSTQFGAVLGTLEYMAPEQAGFSGEDIDTRADIYSLGVVLYELLTGLRPINAKRLHKAALAEMLRIIQEEEPSRPSTRLSTDASAPSLAALRQTEPKRLATLLRGELDWVVMRCLEKRRDRRYETANGLARDVQRYLADEPVEARPPSAGYRLGKFLKRNRGPVIAAGLLLLALVGGIAGTSWGLLEARGKEKAAVDARNDLATKNTELEQAQDRLEGALARTWLSPLAEAAGPLTDAEIGALSQVSSAGNDRLAERFLKEALASRPGMRKLRARAGFALQAVAGLDARKRQEVERRLVSALESPDLADDARDDLALTALELGGLSAPAAAELAQTLLQGFTRAKDLNTRLSQMRGVSALADRMEPRAAARVSARAVALLTLAMTDTGNRVAVGSYAEVLPAAAAHLESGDAAAAAATLTQAMAKTNDFVASPALARGLSAVAAHLEPGGAAATAATLTQAMGKPQGRFVLLAEAQGLSAVAGRLEPGDAAAAAATLTDAMAKTNDAIALQYLSQGLSALAGRLEPREASRVSAAAAATLTRAMAKTNDADALASLSLCLSALAGRLEPRDAAAAAATLTQAIGKTNDAVALFFLSVGLSELAGCLEPGDAAAAAATLTDAMAKTDDAGALRILSQRLSVLADRLEPGEASRVSAAAAATLTQAMAKTNDGRALQSLSQGLSVLADRLEPGEASRVSAAAAATLTQAMAKTNDANALLLLSDANALLLLSVGLSELAGRLEPRDASRVSAAAAATLIQAMAKTNDNRALVPLSQGLSKLADRLEPQDAAAAAATLTDAMAKTNNYNGEFLQYLSQGLSAMAGRLEPRDAARVSAAAAATLTQAMAKHNDDIALASLAPCLSALAGRLEPRDAAAAAAALAQAMAKTNDANALQYLARGLSALADRLEPGEAARVSAAAAATLTQAMAKTNDPNALQLLSVGLSALAGRMQPKEAATTLTLAMSRTDGIRLTSLALAFPNVLGDGRRLERVRALARTVGCLSESMGLPGALALLEPAAEPFPRRLSDQELVDLLKGPLCVGPARRAVLDHLECRYGRAFADQWDFVRFAEERKLGLDFTRTPQRP